MSDSKTPIAEYLYIAEREVRDALQKITSAAADVGHLENHNEGLRAAIQAVREERDRLRAALRVEEGRAGRLQDVIRWAYRNCIRESGFGTDLRDLATKAGANLTTDAKIPEATPAPILIGLSPQNAAEIRHALTVRANCILCRFSIVAERNTTASGWRHLYPIGDEPTALCTDPAVQNLLERLR